MKLYSAVLTAALVGFAKAKGVDDAFAPNIQNDVDPLNVVARLTTDGEEVGGVATSVAVSTSNIRGAAPFSVEDVVNTRDWDSNNSINLDLEDDSQVTLNKTLLRATDGDEVGGDAILVAVSTSNIRGAATFSIKDVVDTKQDWDSKDSINLDLEDDPQVTVKKTLLKKRLGNHMQVKVKVDNKEFPKLNKEESKDAMEIEVYAGGIVDNLPCADSVITVQTLIASNFLGGLEGSDMDGLDGNDGTSISIASVLQSSLDILDEEGTDPTFAFLLPQKVCKDAGENNDIPARGESERVDACGSLDMLGDTDVLAFGYQQSGRGVCAAFNDATKTYALAQVGILPEIKIHALTLTLDAIAVSIDKKLTATTLNKMWDGVSSPKELDIPGHFVIRGTGSLGLKLSTAVDLTLSCDTTVLVDADYNNNGVAPVNGAVDFAMLLSGSISPTFEVMSVNKNGQQEKIELDLSSVFTVDADLYQFVNGNYKSVQLAVSRNFDLVQLCDIAAPFEVFCIIFKEASFQSAVRAYANNDGFGIQFSLEATLDFKNGFDLVEDLVGWPDDNQVSASLELKLKNKRLSACVEFEGAQFCTGKCQADADCDDPLACDSVFKVCRKKRDIGGKCGRDFFCKSGHCVSGFCRECPNAGSTTGCPSGEFCQRVYNFQAHVCRPKLGIGGSCSGSGSCLSGYCVSGFCRQCPNAGSTTGCPSGQFCQRLYNARAHVCRPKKGVGGSCSGSGSCLSNDCSSTGFCNGCANAGSRTGCPSGQYCKWSGTNNKCVYLKGIGDTCSKDTVCSSNDCRGAPAGFCNQCPNAGSRTGCPSGQYCKWAVTNNACVGLKPRSATCGSNGSVCQSGRCRFGFCTKP